MVLNWEFNGCSSWASLYFTPKLKVPAELRSSPYSKGRNDQNSSTVQVDPKEDTRWVSCTIQIQEAFQLLLPAKC